MELPFGSILLRVSFVRVKIEGFRSGWFFYEWEKIVTGEDTEWWLTGSTPSVWALCNILLYNQSCLKVKKLHCLISMRFYLLISFPRLRTEIINQQMDLKRPIELTSFSFLFNGMWNIKCYKGTIIPRDKLTSPVSYEIWSKVTTWNYVSLKLWRGCGGR